MIGARVVDGFPALTLASTAAGGIEATFVPGAGMVGCSLRHRGEELLGQRRGLRAYVAERATMGIPLLYPWANRVGSMRFPVAGREVAIDPEATPLRRDADGLAMHGLLTAASGWQVERHEGVADGAAIAARFDFAAHDALMAAYPFAHQLRFEATLTGPTLTIVTTVQPSGDGPVPIAFGYHPYLRLPGLAREEWHIEVPVREQLRLDSQMLPTGERVTAEVHAGRLGARTFDDAFVAPPDGAPFVLSGGGRRIELAFLNGYPYAQVFAPAEDDVIAFEPMTAPTNALVDGGAELPLVAPGESYEASFSITLADDGPASHPIRMIAAARRSAYRCPPMTPADVRPVVLAYDGSAEAEAALREAVALFGQRPFIVVSVWEPGLAMATMMPAAGEPSMGYMPDPNEVAAIDRAQSGHAGDVSEAGARLARELGATAEALSVPDSVNIAGTLIAIAEEHDARAIVVGSRGLGGIKARVLGSTSRKLLHDTHRPVLVVRTPEQ